MNLHFGYILSILLAALMLPATRAAACPTEADLSNVGAEPGAALADCTALSRFEIPTGRGPVAGVVYGTPDADPAIVAGIKTALIRSGTVLQGLGALGTEPVEAFISPTPYVVNADGGNARAVTSSAIDIGPENPSTCIIVMFQGNPRDELGPVVAHEFFHCVQLEEFQAQDEAIGSEWWAEGTANWFSSQVYQGTEFIDLWVANFDVLSVDTPITRMKYDSVVFFWWLSQNFGTEAVIDLIEAMPSTDSSQDEALARLMDDDMFVQFVQDYLDQKITQPGGRAILSTPVFGPVIRLRTDFEVSLNAARFVAFRVRMQLDCGEWTTTDNGLQGRYQLRRLPGDTWEPLPETIRSDSEDTIRYQMAAGGTGVEGFNIEIELEKTPCAFCQNVNYADGPEGDLVGEWRLTSGGYGAKISEMLESLPDMQNVDMPDMDGILRLNADGSFVLRADDSGSMETTSPGGKLFSADIEFNMERRGTWALNGDRLEQCYSPDIDISIEETLSDPDHVSETFSMTEFLGAPQSYTVKRRFIYTPGRLELTERALFAPTITWVYEK